MKTPLCLRLLMLAAVLMCLLPGPARALNDIYQYKLFGHWTSPTPTGYFFGANPKVNETWAVVASPYPNEPATYVGSVQVFSAVTGAWTRRLVSPSSTAFSYFGNSLAISGDLAVVGAPGVAGAIGAAYIYNLKTGALLRTLTVAGGVAGDSFGSSVAISGQRALVGAPGYNSGRGAVYVYHLTTGAPLGRMDLGGGGVVSDRFGSAVAAEGSMAFIGAPGVASNKGAGYLFNAETLQQAGALFQPAGLVASDQAGISVAMSRGRVFLGAYGRNSYKGAVFCALKYNTATFTEITASDGAGGDYFGFSISADAGMLLVGAYGVTGATGAAYLYDVGAPGTAATEVRKIQPRDVVAGQYFGIGVGMCGNTAVIGSYLDSTQAASAGAAYLMRPLIVPFSALTKVAAKGEFAPGVPEATFKVMGDAFVNGYSKVAFFSTLAGLGSNGGKDTGVWSNLKTTPSNLQLVCKTRQKVTAGEQVVQAMSPPLINESGHARLPVTMQVGTGTPAVTTTTTKWLLDQGTSGAPTFLTSNGIPVGVASYGAARVLSFTETVQGVADGGNHWGTAVRLTPGLALGTSATNDSGVLLHSGASVEGYREGADTIPTGGVFYGQFTGRLALMYFHYAFSAATMGLPATNQVVVRKPLLSGVPVIAAQKGDTAPESTGSPIFASLVGEGCDGGGTVLVRATLSGGTGVTVANNEGVWSRELSGTKHQVLRKGQTITGTTLAVAKILSVWGGWWQATQPRFFVLVQLKGLGVNASNDQALVLVQEGSTAAAPNLYLLMREGDPALGEGTGRIGTINRVIVDAFLGNYLVLVTLAGAPAGTELALYGARLSNESGFIVGNATTGSIVRRPSLLLRKGWLFDGQPGRIKSISLPAGTVTPSGIGGTGRATAIGWSGTLVVTVEFENGVRQVMNGAIP